MSGSISFDRAASDYDRTRTTSPEARTHQADVLSAELRDRGRALEVGVGTGRIALSLHERGVPMAGVDLSAQMLARLVANAGGAATPFPLARADATRLPFRPEAFGAALASHVFHLIPRWRDAVAEMVRVVRAGGVALVALGGLGTGPYRDIVDHVAAALDVTRRFPGLDTGAGDPPDAVDDAFAALGCRGRALPQIVSRETITVNEVLRHFATRTWSWTFDFSDEQVERGVRAGRDWGTRRFGDLDRPLDHETPIRWKAFDIPA